LCTSHRRFLSLFVLTNFLFFSNLVGEYNAYAKKQDDQEKQNWQNRLVGYWNLTFKGDKVKHPVTIVLKDGNLNGSYQTQKKKSLPLKGIFLEPPRPMPKGGSAAQIDFHDDWCLFFDIPMSPKAVSCRFDLETEDAKIIYGTSWFTEGTGQGKGSNSESGNTSATLTRNQK
jgi:hypothetical protein